MNHRSPPRTRDVLRPVLVPVLLGCALAALGLTIAHRVAAHHERQSAQMGYLRTLTRMGAMTVEQCPATSPISAVEARFKEWAWTVLYDPAVLAVALLDAQAEVLCLEPSDIARPEAVQSAVTTDGGMDLGTRLGRATVVRSTSASGLTVLLIAPIASVWPAWSLADVYLCLGLVGGFVVIGWSLLALLERAVSRPLHSLIEATQPWSRRDTSTLATGRRDPFGHLGRNIATLFDENNSLSDRLQRNERNMDARVAAQTRQIRAMLDRAEKRAWIDPLTKLGNRHLLDDRLEELVHTQREMGEDLALVMFDLDNFKVLNDTLGHAAGDELLAFVGQLLRGSLRSSDIGIRYGGDEFALLLLGTGSAEAAETADRLLKLFTQRASLYRSDPRPGMSAGVASLQDHQTQNGADLMNLADQALYQAKRSGRGVVQVAPLNTARRHLVSTV